MKNKKVSIPIYEGMELKMTVDNGFLVAEYSEEEKQQLLEAMHKDGKDWDEVNKKVIDYIEPIKVGDICILWDADKSHAIIDKVVDISFNSMLPYTTNSDGYENAIKCDSIEQYIEFKQS